MEFLLSLSLFAIVFYTAHRFAWQPARGWLERRGIELTVGRFLLFLLSVGVFVVLMLGGMVGAPLGLLLVIFVAWGIWKNKVSKRDGHQRGGMIVAANELEKLAKTADPQSEIFVGAVGVPRNAEARHCLVAGATGSGKSQAFYQIIQAARKRGDGGICADVNAEMLGRFFDETRGDILLSPLDSRTANWSPLTEIFGTYDADRIAKSIIPDGDGSSAEWNHYSQGLLAAVLIKVWSENGKNFELTNLVLSATNEELAEALEGSQAAQLFAPGAERMLSSIRAITATYCKPLSYLNPSVGRDGFSITKFIHDEAEQKRGAWLFLPVRDDFFQSLRTLVAGQIDIAISALLSATDDEQRRIWFVIDEFATWGKISSVLHLLTKARKKGGVGALGLQTISQIREAYGQHSAQTILASLGNWLTLRTGDAETAEYMSKAIGDEQVRRTNESTNAEGQTTRSEQIAQQRTVMPAELQNLPDLVGILNIAGPLPAGWVTIPVSNLQRKTEGFQIVRS
jgi:type IV secretory pathway TraG/TraD family ATPase VirD4